RNGNGADLQSPETIDLHSHQCAMRELTDQTPSGRVRHQGAAIHIKRADVARRQSKSFGRIPFEGTCFMKRANQLFPERWHDLSFLIERSAASPLRELFYLLQQRFSNHMDIKRPSILQFESRMLRSQSRQSFRNFNFRMSAAWREHRGDHGNVRCALADEVFDRFTNTGSAEFVIGQRKEGAI